MKTDSNLSFYAESSALAKLYVQEKGSGVVLELFRAGNNAFYTSKLTLIEISSALYRKRKEDEITELHYREAKQHLLADYDYSLATIDVDNGIIKSASLLVEKHFLRAYDAVHLASALWVKGQIEQIQKGQEAQFILLSSDERLVQAAVRENLQVIDPNISFAPRN